MMKKIGLSVLLLFAPLFGQDGPFYPFNVNGCYLGVSEAEFHTAAVEGQTLRYTQVDGAFTFTYPFNPICGLLVGTSFIASDVDWKENPDFHETRFNYVNFSVGGFTRSFPDWLWTSTVGVFIDTEELDFADYAIFQGVLQGEYDINDWAAVDLGFIFEDGLNQEKIWPIFGFEFSPYECWTLSLVYPTNIYFEYDILPQLSALVSIRFLRNHHRVKDTEPEPKGIFIYQTWGGEFDLVYNPLPGLSVKGFAGSTFGGDLKITDRNFHQARHYEFDGSFYAGGSLGWDF